MSPSNSVIRRYTPPTCTLEIRAQNSSLSRWMEETVIKDLNFRLQFDDPRLPEQQKILIQGDQQQLEVLCNIVTTYVQQLLQQSAEDFSINLLDTDNGNTASEPELKNTPPSVFPRQTLPSFNPQIPQTKVYLEPSRNLTHKLFFGDLANQTSGLFIELSLLQLFDLATALDEYSSDMIALPTTSNQTVQTSLPQWAPIAAVLVLAAGLAPFTWQYANNSQKAAKKANPAAQQLAIKPAPGLNLTSPQPQLTPALPSFSPPPASLSFPNATIPAAPTTSSPPALTIPSNSSSSPINPQVPLPPITLNTTSASRTQVIPNSPSILAKNGINTTKLNNLPSANLNILPSVSQPAKSIASIPNNSFSNSPNTLPTTSAMELTQGAVGISSPYQPSQAENRDNLVRRLRAATKTSSVTPVNNNQTLFDTPQVAEAREYLNKRWQPPTGLSQALEYSLILGVDGKIERILPLNQVAREYIDSSGIPEIGKPFVSTNKSGQNLRIRVVLSPDSKVQTFPETP
ncbi:MAG: DUF4335 domain-containing protein [Dolichospermum sp.]|nr:DUF4335 domain-containing protein [Dolichospermum sp.]